MTVIAMLDRSSDETVLKKLQRQTECLGPTPWISSDD